MRTKIVEDYVQEWETGRLVSGRCFEIDKMTPSTGPIETKILDDLLHTNPSRKY
jgi:hypothetical protein